MLLAYQAAQVSVPRLQRRLYPLLTVKYRIPIIVRLRPNVVQLQMYVEANLFRGFFFKGPQVNFSKAGGSMTSQEALLWWIGALSLGLFLASIILLPVLLVHLPHDYLSQRNPGHSKPKPRLYRVARNLVGGLFVLAGIVMLVMPGQGLLTILIGITLMDFPKKQAFLRRVVARQRVLRSINRIRGRFGRPPLRAPGKSEEQGA